MTPDEVRAIICDPQTTRLGHGYFERAGVVYFITRREIAALVGQLTDEVNDGLGLVQ